MLTKLPQLPGEMLPVVDAITRQSQYMAALLEDLLDVARITEGKIELRKQLFNLHEIVEPTVESVQPLLDSRPQTLELNLTSQALPIVGNPVRLRQIASNLLSNASKYSPPGTRVKFAIDRNDHHAELRVVDQGEGIPPEYLRRVFDPFEQLGRSHDRTDGGMGIGLTLSQRLVQLHGGSIEALSDGAGQGSEFVVRLPVVDATKVESTAHPSRRAKGEQLHVALVEDNSDAREMLRVLLEQDGYRVAVAGTGPDGLTLISDMQPDVALVDIGLPGCDGYAIAQQVRSRTDLDRVYLVALTGFGQPSDRQRAFEAGFDTHFTKPVDLQELSKLLNQFRPMSGNAGPTRDHNHA